MATIRPFNGIRFDPATIKDLSAVITQPYDTISSEEQEYLHHKSPYNIIRLEYGKSNPSDTATDNQYTRAATTLHRWLDQGILTVEQTKSFYFYEQEFIFQQNKYRRRGFFAALKLEPYSNGTIRPHEATMAAPKEDRFHLLQATRANFSPIFTLMPDPENRIEGYCRTIMAEKPLCKVGENSNLVHRIWRVDQPDLIEDLTAYLEGQSLLIADGHHRYETALNYLEGLKSEAAPGAGYILAALVSIHDPGLLMLPTHRLLSGLNENEKARLEKMINESFTVLFENDLDCLNRADFLEKLNRISIEQNGFGYITGEKACLLIPDSIHDRTGGNAPAVTLLHERLLNRFSRQTDSANSPAYSIDFSHDFDAALEKVTSGTADAGFFLGKFPVTKVLAETGQKRLLPQKSTYFYPKMPGGLVSYHMDYSF